MIMNDKMQEDKLWQYLTDDEIDFLSDVRKQSIYRRKIKQIINFVICPLYMHALKNGYENTDFEKLETVHEMVIELKKFYDQKGITQEEKIKIIRDSRIIK